MKLVKLFAVAVVAASAYSASAQSSGGQLLFTTFTSTAGQGQVFDVGGAPLGSTFDGEIYTSLTGANGTFQAAGGIQTFQGPVGTSFAGGYVVAATTVVSPNVGVGANGFYEVKVWNASAGSTFEQASTVVGAQVGSSASVAIGPFGGTPSSGPNITAPPVNTFGSFTLTTVAAVPEPSTIALGIVGMAGLLALRRRQ